MYEDRFYVLDVGDIRKMVMKKTHDVPYVRHSVYEKTIAALRNQYYWPGMKSDVAEYIARCM